MDVKDKVKAEMERFRAALPALLAVMPGRWVVFHAGAVESQHDNEDAAYVHAVKVLGREAGFVVAKVEEERPQPLTARHAFGIA